MIASALWDQLDRKSHTRMCDYKSSSPSKKNILGKNNSMLDSYLPMPSKPLIKYHLPAHYEWGSVSEQTLWQDLISLEAECSTSIQIDTSLHYVLSASENTHFCQVFLFPTPSYTQTIKRHRNLLEMVLLSSSRLCLSPCFQDL